MWSLIPIETDAAATQSGGSQRFRLLAGRPYKLGRHSCDFNVTNDKSISRLHATLEVQHPETNIAHPHKPPVLKITDSSSKFGTFVQEEKISGECIIKSLDVVKFGTMSSDYRAIYEPYVVTTSCLDAAAKKQTKLTISRLGAHMVSDWRKECQLLIMTSLSVTVKVICALVSLKPIVTVEYLEELAKCIDTKEELPSPDLYIPPLAESQLNPNEVSFQRDERRKTLFQGKIFIFLNPKQFKKLNIAVELAGGTPMLMEEGTDDNEDDILLQDSTCVMQCDLSDVTHQLSQNAHDWIKHVFSVLKKNGRRPIPDCELGFAVLFCSTNRYCNPSVEAGSEISSTVPSQSVPEVSMAASVTPSTKNSQRHSTNKHSLPASLATTLGSETVKEEPVTPVRQNKRQGREKRTRDDAEEDLHPPAKVAKVMAEVKQEEEQTVPKGRKLKSRSRSPSPVPCSDSSPSKRRPSRPGKRSFSPSPSPSPPRRSKRSPSPAPKPSKHKSQNSGATSQPKRSPSFDDDPSDEFDAFQPRSKRKTAASKATDDREVSPEPTVSRPSVFSRVSSKAISPEKEKKDTARRQNLIETVDESDDDDGDDDPFGSFKPRSRKAKSPSPAPNTATLLSPAASPAPSPPPPSSSRRRGTSPVPVVVKDEPISARKETRTRGKRIDVDVEEDSDSKIKQERPSRTLDVKPKKEVRPKKELDYGLPSHTTSTGVWLTTKQPISEQVSATRDNCDSDSGAPVKGGTVTVVKSLVVSANNNRLHENKNKSSYNSTTTKNFKRFKKILPAGSDGLPRIIGGSDLTLHLNSSRDVDKWFEDEQNEMEARTAASQEADALFSWEPTIRKKTGRR